MTILTYHEYLLERKLEHSKESYRRYRKYYQRLYQRQRRKKHKEVTLLLSSDDHTRLKAGAITHKQSLTKFIVSCAMAYLDTKYITPNESTVSGILQHLSGIYTQVQHISDQLPTNGNDQVLKHIFHILSKHEQVLEKLLTNPDSLEDVIKSTLHSHPHYYKTLSNLLNAYDHQS